MLEIVNLPQEALVAAAESHGLEATVGPTSATGWTAIWSPRTEELVSSGLAVPYLAVVETYEDVHLHADAGSSGVLLHSWSANQVDLAGSAEVMAVGLCQMFGCPDRLHDLEQVLSWDPGDTEELLESLGSVLDLPELTEPPPALGVVVHRGDPGNARMAAAVAGPAYVREVPAKVGAGSDAWTVLVASEEDATRTLRLAAGLSGAAGRREPVFLLWRDGAASGWQLWHKGKLAADGSWHGRWRLVVPDPLREEAENVRQLVKAMGDSVDQSALRALMRRRRPERDPLAELVAILNLPADVLEAAESADRPSELAGFELIEQMSVREVMRHSWQGGFGEAEKREAFEEKVTSVLSTPLAIGTVVGAVVSVLMTALSVGTLLTNGALVDQAGTSSEDWAFLGLFATLSLVLIPTAVVRIRRVRRRRGARAVG